MVDSVGIGFHVAANFEKHHGNAAQRARKPERQHEGEVLLLDWRTVRRRAWPRTATQLSQAARAGRYQREGSIATVPPHMFRDPFAVEALLRECEPKKYP